MKKREKNKTLELLKHHGNSNKQRSLKGRELSIKTVGGSFPLKLRSDCQLGELSKKADLGKGQER